MNRGDIVIVATRGAYTGKPRPALVVQDDDFNPTHASVTLCPITSDCVDAPLFRVSLPAGPRTGLTRPSQVMVACGSCRSHRQPRFLVRKGTFLFR